MTQIYKLTKEAIEEKIRERSKDIKTTFPIAYSIALLVWIINAGVEWSQVPLMLLMGIPWVVIASYVTFKRIEAQQREYWTSYKLQWEKDIIRQIRANGKDICISKSEIAVVTEYEWGILVETATGFRKISILNKLDNFTQLVHGLQVVPDKRVSQSRRYKRIISSLIVWTSCLILFITESKILGITAGTLVITLYLEMAIFSIAIPEIQRFGFRAIVRIDFLFSILSSIMISCMMAYSMYNKYFMQP